jgi:hypothetical protein
MASPMALQQEIVRVLLDGCYRDLVIELPRVEGASASIPYQGRGWEGPAPLHDNNGGKITIRPSAGDNIH